MAEFTVEPPPQTFTVEPPPKKQAAGAFTVEPPPAAPAPSGPSLVSRAASYVGGEIGQAAQGAWDQLKADAMASGKIAPKDAGGWDQAKAQFDRFIAAGKLPIDAFNLVLSPVSGAIEALAVKPYGKAVHAILPRVPEAVAERDISKAIWALAPERGAVLRGGIEAGMKPAEGAPAHIVPAVRKPAGEVVRGEPLTRHADIPGITDKDERGFVGPDGQFMTRQEAGQRARAAGLSVPERLHSEDLQKIASAQPLKGARQDVAAMGSAVQDGAKAVEKLFSPTTVSPVAGGTERVIRRATGEGSLEAEKSAAQLVKYNRQVGNLPVDQQRALVDYIERRSQGAPKPADPGLQKAADAIANVYDRYRKRIEYVLGPDRMPSFIKDYYVHLWKEQPAKVADTLNAYFSRQGTARNLKKRTIPTIEEGVRAGLTPRIENPIEATMAYARNMSRFLATHDIQNEMRRLGYAKWFAPGKEPAGWRQLEGIMTDKIAKAEDPYPIRLYAPEDAARVYNNHVSKGLEQGDAGPFFVAARRLNNGLTMLKLGLSTFHLNTMANEGIIGEVARAMVALSRGELKAAGKAAVRAPAAPVSLAMRGKRMGDELLGLKMPDSLSAKVNDAFVRSGGRIHMDPFYRTRGAGSFFDAMRRGTFKRELGDAFDFIYKGTPLEKMKGTVDLAANAIQMVSAPLFEMYIPAIKRGAFSSRMEDFLRSNPMATQDEIDRYAIRLNDSIDNRFGEMVQDNYFWARWMKQIAQLLLLSASWDIGTVREIAGGIKDVVPSVRGIAEGKGITDRTAYVLALATVVPLFNGVMTYLKTGTAPHGMDYLAYRTGGTQTYRGGRVGTATVPERGLLPGYQKDVYAFGYNFPHDILPEIQNKMSLGFGTVADYLSNKDWRELPIYRPQGVKPVEGEPTLLDDVIQRAMPISFGNLEKKRGSKLSAFERFGMAARPAPEYLTAPSFKERTGKYYATKEWQKRIKAEKRAKAQVEP